MKNITKKSIGWAGVVALILLVPLVAMQFTDEVDWDSEDFVAIGVLLFGAGMAYEFLAAKTSTGALRVAIGVVVLVAVLLIWAELAVGIFGTPWAGS